MSKQYDSKPDREAEIRKAYARRREDVPAPDWWKKVESSSGLTIVLVVLLVVALCMVLGFI